MTRYLVTKTYRASVDDSGIVRIWDEIAGHYTVCHSLTAGQMAYIARMAK